ncbi:hypothetical protein HYFRA_00008523 [Hymenoscyphus fraxineus]|uniref:Uncharacterized protein n=1 Tax=Hymenoscyphus fraxineus TaxID=746836 RepID=A0A9N9KYD0_9HELO|nr:hypothetical protein HYFRA_00008523 [Hymenoscyphus fraxineus]
MQLSTNLLLALSTFSSLAAAQIAAGGGAVISSPAATQMATTSKCRSLATIDGKTTAIEMTFTQTFAKTALGTWALPPTPGVGTIGLGDIQGQIGVMKTKRGLDAVQTPGPMI